MPGAQILAFALPALPGSTGGPPVQFVIRTAGDYQTLAGVLGKTAGGGEEKRAVHLHRRRSEIRHAAMEVKIDAAKANALGISMQDIGATLATFLGGNYVNRFNLYGRSYQVIPQAPRDFRLDPRTG